MLPVPNEVAAELVRDPRLPVVSFTGSVPVGWSIRDSVPRKHVTLELGGNAAVVVGPDQGDEESLAWAASRIATFAMYQAGQSCISVQRVFAHRDVAAPLAERVVAAVQALTTGDPTDEKTDVGPLIDEAAATPGGGLGRRRRRRRGARAHRRGARRRHVRADGAHRRPGRPPGCPATRCSGPSWCWTRSTRSTRRSPGSTTRRFGLQAGVFTRDLQVAFRAAQELEVGGVVIGDVPSFRADQMPYGGVKDSGTGREGVHSAMEDLTEERVLVLTGIAL